ncbi:MAG: hypothetical protein LQ341_006843, partial [Variospora aurantia]
QYGLNGQRGTIQSGPQHQCYRTNMTDERVKIADTLETQPDMVKMIFRHTDANEPTEELKGGITQMTLGFINLVNLNHLVYLACCDVADAHAKGDKSRRLSADASGGGLSCPSQHKRAIECPCVPESLFNRKANKFKPTGYPSIVFVPPGQIGQWLNVRVARESYGGFFYPASERRRKGSEGRMMHHGPVLIRIPVVTAEVTNRLSCRADQFLIKQDDYQWRIRYAHGAPQEGFDKFSTSDAAYVNGRNKEDENLLIVVTSNKSYHGQVA